MGHLSHTGILYPMKKKIQEGLLQYRCSAAALNTGLMYSVYTSIKLGIFHSSFYNMKVNIRLFFSYILIVQKKIYRSYVCKKRKPEKLMFCYLNPSLHSPYVWCSTWTPGSLWEWGRPVKNYQSCCKLRLVML